MLMLSKLFAKAAIYAAFAITFCHVSLAQGVVAVEKPADAPVKKTVTSLPKVKQIDIDGLRKLLKPNGKPLLINFWATWCDPCREEFPDLVKISSEFHGKVDFITVSLDELSDINTYVPKFLGEMKSEMPTYLLHTPDEGAAISMVSKNWSGNLPMTVLFDTGGGMAYERNGKIRVEVLRENIRKLLPVDQQK